MDYFNALHISKIERDLAIKKQHLKHVHLTESAQPRFKLPFQLIGRLLKPRATRFKLRKV